MPPELTELEVLKQENARLRAALEFYADENTYKSSSKTFELMTFFERGKKAREALKSPHDGKEIL